LEAEAGEAVEPPRSRSLTLAERLNERAEACIEANESCLSFDCGGEARRGLKVPAHLDGGIAKELCRSSIGIAPDPFKVGRCFPECSEEGGSLAVVPTVKKEANSPVGSDTEVVEVDANCAEERRAYLCFGAWPPGDHLEKTVIASESDFW